MSDGRIAVLFAIGFFGTLIWATLRRIERLLRELRDHNKKPKPKERPNPLVGSAGRKDRRGRS